MAATGYTADIFMAPNPAYNRQQDVYTYTGQYQAQYQPAANTYNTSNYEINGSGAAYINQSITYTDISGYVPTTLRGRGGETVSLYAAADTGVVRPVKERDSPEGSEGSTEVPFQKTDMGEFKCNECNKVFNKMCYLKQHNKSFHNGEKPFKCTQCGKRFAVDVLYQEHLAKHAGDKPYKCEVCPKQFNHKTDLRRHMCLHTGEKPFSCEVCGKGFIREDRMVKHAETHKKKAAGGGHPAVVAAAAGLITGPGIGAPPPPLAAPPSAIM